MTTHPLSENIVIGVLALQGAFIEHIHYLQRAHMYSTLISLSLQPQNHTIIAIPVRTLTELNACNALIIPGGESTVIASVASHTPGLLEGLQAFVRNPEIPVWGTCAGMILMAEEDGIGGGKSIKGRERQKGWGGIEGMKVWRNLYGTQLESFEAPLLIPALSDPTRPFITVFIRAPAIHSLISPSHPTAPIEALCTLPVELIPSSPPEDGHLGAANLDDLGKVMVRQGRKLVTSFHPELSGD
ncbi:MAG: hypothetical protein TREMPRED_000355 [Tremellales sp. Tagirdzhanova-0007]|nr:MAG: hypothetical protein TREMPRED_000355 [Tremellales sp. Tagirdzhanova-0007]